MLRTILSVSGKPGLYKLISQGKNMLILETLDATRKEFLHMVMIRLFHWAISLCIPMRKKSLCLKCSNL
jgi:hypothetical protein